MVTKVDLVLSDISENDSANNGNKYFKNKWLMERQPNVIVGMVITSQVQIVMRIWRYVRIKWSRILIGTKVTTG